MKVLLPALFALLLFTNQSLAEPRYRGMVLGQGLTSTDIDDLAVFAPNIVRYNLSWHIFADTATYEEYLTWLETALTQLDTLLPSFEQHNMKVMVQLFTPPGGFASYQSPPYHRLFAEAAAQDTFRTTWQRIAQRYVNNSTIWGYDLQNEPAQRQVASGLKDWAALSAEVAMSVRALDPVKSIILEPIYGNSALLGRLKPPAISNLMIGIHNYFPISFNRQGLPGTKYGVKYPSKKYNKKMLKAHFKNVIAYQKKKKAVIFVNEAGVIRWGPGSSSYNFLRDLLSIFESQKWHWTYHAFRESDAWSVEHGTDRFNSEKSATETDRARLLKAYFAKNGS